MPSWFHTIPLALHYILFPLENLVCYPKVSHSTKTILCSLEVLSSTTDAQGTSLTTPTSLITPDHGALHSTLFLQLSPHQKCMGQHCSQFDAYHFTLTIFVSLLAAICTQHFPNLVIWVVFHLLSQMIVNISFCGCILYGVC